MRVSAVFTDTLCTVIQQVKGRVFCLQVNAPELGCFLVVAQHEGAEPIKVRLFQQFNDKCLILFLFLL